MQYSNLPVNTVNTLNVLVHLSVFIESYGLEKMSDVMEFIPGGKVKAESLFGDDEIIEGEVFSPADFNEKLCQCTVDIFPGMDLCTLFDYLHTKIYFKRIFNRAKEKIDAFEEVEENFWRDLCDIDRVRQYALVPVLA